jgi:hypothetical protein
MPRVNSHASHVNWFCVAIVPIHDRKKVVPHNVMKNSYRTVDPMTLPQSMKYRKRSGPCQTDLVMVRRRWQLLKEGLHKLELKRHCILVIPTCRFRSWSDMLLIRYLRALLSPLLDWPKGFTKLVWFHHSSKNCWLHSVFRTKNIPVDGQHSFSMSDLWTFHILCDGLMATQNHKAQEIYLH